MTQPEHSGRYYFAIAASVALPLLVGTQIFLQSYTSLSKPVSYAVAFILFLTALFPHRRYLVRRAGNELRFRAYVFQSVVAGLSMLGAYALIADVFSITWR